MATGSRSSTKTIRCPRFIPGRIHAAVDANCLAAQNGDAYWDFADYIHANKREVDDEKTPAARFDAIDKMTLLQGQKHNLDAAKLQSCVKAQNEDAVRASMKEADGLGRERNAGPVH